MEGIGVLWRVRGVGGTVLVNFVLQHFLFALSFEFCIEVWDFIRGKWLFSFCSIC